MKKLVGIYVQRLKEELMTQVRLLQDPLTAAQLFMSCCQKPCEKVNDFAAKFVCGGISM